MTMLPNEFRDEFDGKGGTLFEIAELLYSDHGKQFTQEEIAADVGVSKPRVSKLLSEMEDDWVNKQSGDYTIVWNTQTYNPAITEPAAAVRGFYADLWQLLHEHTKTGPGIITVTGAAMFASAIVVSAFYIGASIASASAGIPAIVYLVISLGLMITGGILTTLAPIQATTNKAILCIFRSVTSKERTD